jgi:hypothetical protein
MANRRERVKKLMGGVVDLAAAAETARQEDARLAAEAYAKADAWARSDPGTPYGVTEPVNSWRTSGGER